MRDAFVSIQHFGYASRVVGTPGNLELRNLKRRGTTRLAFNIVGLAGLVGDVDAGYAGDAAENGAVYKDHLWRSLRRDLRADL